jgi:hypothetical protein
MDEGMGVIHRWIAIDRCWKRSEKTVGRWINGWKRASKVRKSELPYRYIAAAKEEEESPE